MAFHLLLVIALNEVDVSRASAACGPTESMWVIRLREGEAETWPGHATMLVGYEADGIEWVHLEFENGSSITADPQ